MVPESQSGLPCSCPAGSVVGLALHRGSTALPCPAESTRRVKAVSPPPLSETDGSDGDTA